MKKCLLQSYACFVYGVVLMPAIAFAEDDAKKSITLGASALEGVQKSNVWFGNYKQSSDGNGGFKVEPIKWRALRNSEGLVWLLSDKILDTYRYHNDNGWFQDVYWQDCLMRKWLNSEVEEGGFSDAAFSPKKFSAVAMKEEWLGKVMLLSPRRNQIFRVVFNRTNCSFGGGQRLYRCRRNGRFPYLWGKRRLGPSGRPRYGKRILCRFQRSIHRHYVWWVYYICRPPVYLYGQHQGAVYLSCRRRKNGVRADCRFRLQRGRLQADGIGQRQE